MQIEVVVGDITAVEVDVIVTAANRHLAGGGGVDDAVHRAAGPELVAASRALAPCPPGSAVITDAFRLNPPVRHVVHAVGPRYGIDEPAAHLLAQAYLASLRLCDDAAASSVAFPCLSAGAYGYPLAEACAVSIRALTGARTGVERCLLVAFGPKVEHAWQRALLAGRP